MYRIITCETWVSRRDYYLYAMNNTSYVPHLLVDRSMCQDPYLDQFQSHTANASPLISGLCRGLSGFVSKNDVVIYITRVPTSVLRLIFNNGYPH